MTTNPEMCPRCGGVVFGDPDREKVCGPLSSPECWQVVGTLPKIGSDHHPAKSAAEKLTVKGQG